jgi:hypothetical protein
MAERTLGMKCGRVVRLDERVVLVCGARRRKSSSLTFNGARDVERFVSADAHVEKITGVPDGVPSTVTGAMPSASAVSRERSCRWRLCR